jgi:hypothetical protein
MKKSSKYFLGLFIIFVIIMGFTIPSIYQQFYKIDHFFEEDKAYKYAAEPFQALLLAAKQIENNGQYPNRCEGRGYKQILLQTYSWMMIRGPIIEACVAIDGKGNISGIKSLGKFPD